MKKYGLTIETSLFIVVILIFILVLINSYSINRIDTFCESNFIIDGEIIKNNKTGEEVIFITKCK